MVAPLKNTTSPEADPVLDRLLPQPLPADLRGHVRFGGVQHGVATLLADSASTLYLASQALRAGLERDIKLALAATPALPAVRKVRVRRAA